MSSTRSMALTPELVALCHREEPDPGPDPRWTTMSDSDFHDEATRLCQEPGSDPLWLFAYGSLIWKPAFEHVESRRATAFGWHRSFCMELISWRGTREQPGLMMALEHGGRCDGVIYRLPDGNREGQLEQLLRREVSDRESLPFVRWIATAAGRERFKALSFWVGPSGDGFALAQPLDIVARVLARACGHVGSGAEYLHNTVLHLQQCGIHDRNLWKLQDLVAQEIRTIRDQGRESPRPIAATPNGSGPRNRPP